MTARKAPKRGPSLGAAVARDWQPGDRVTVARCLKGFARHLGLAGSVIATPNDGLAALVPKDAALKVVRVELDDGAGRWWFGRGELEPEGERGWF